MKKLIKKIGGFVGVLVLGVFLASCADYGENQTYKTTKVLVIAKYENGNNVVGQTVRSSPSREDIAKVVKKAKEIAKNKGLDPNEVDDNLDWFRKFVQLLNTDTVIKDSILDENGRAEVPILTEYGGIKFGNSKTFSFTSNKGTLRLENQNISSSPINITLPNPN